MQLVFMNIIVAIILITIGLWVELGLTPPIIRAEGMLRDIASGDADLTKIM
jgi:hypothetical protein